MKWKETTAIKRTNAPGLRVGVDMFLARSGDVWYLCSSLRGDIKSRKPLNLVEAGMMIKNLSLIARYSTVFKSEKTYRTKKSWCVIDQVLSQQN